MAKKKHYTYFIQQVNKYTNKEINEASTTIEKLRRERSMKHIKHLI